MKFCFLSSLGLHDHVLEFTQVITVKYFLFKVVLFIRSARAFYLMILLAYTGVDGYMHASLGRIGGD